MIRVLHVLSITALTILLGVAPLLARDLTPRETSALKASMAALDSAFEQKDYGALFGAIPPKIAGHMAQQYGIEPDEAYSVFTSTMAEAMAQVTVVSYDMDLASATVSETSAGRVYVLIPTETVMKIQGDTLQSKTWSLGFPDEDIWYLVRIDDIEQVKILTEVYPDFKGVDFPSGAMKIIED